MLTIQNAMEVASVLSMLCGTYLITKVSFVDFIIREFKDIIVFKNLKPFLRFICRLYSINGNNWPDYLSGRKKPLLTMSRLRGLHGYVLPPLYS